MQLGHKGAIDRYQWYAPQQCLTQPESCGLIVPNSETRNAMIKSQDTLLLLFYMSALAGHPLAADFAKPSDDPAREEILHQYGLSLEFDDIFETFVHNYSLASVGERLELSKAEVHRSHNRLQEANLLKVTEERPFAAGPWLNLHNVAEWVLYGVRYAHPAKNTGFGIGIPTGFNCPLIANSEMMPPDPANVLAGPSSFMISECKGVIITPLDKRLSTGLQLSPQFYELIALVDAVRIGGPRELRYAREGLKDKFAFIAKVQEILFS